MLSKIKKYRHGFVILSYFIVYLILFNYLEQRPVHSYHIVHTVFDDMIPFCEIFIIPYLLWFPYVILTVAYFLFLNKNKREYFQLIFNLMMGMTVFLIFTRISSSSVRLYSRGIIFSPSWWQVSIKQIHRPISCQVFMYSTHLQFISPSATARH